MTPAAAQQSPDLTVISDLSNSQGVGYVGLDNSAAKPVPQAT